MSASYCMHHALRIARMQRGGWAHAIGQLPDTCDRDCGLPKSCRERVADYMRMQWRIAERRETAPKQGRGRR